MRCYDNDLGDAAHSHPQKHLTRDSEPLRLNEISRKTSSIFLMWVRYLMPSVAPVALVAFVVEAISGLQRLLREMARSSQRDEGYESKKRALQAAIQELRKMISANTQ
jgi:Na+/H+ antiporter NhaC